MFHTIRYFMLYQSYFLGSTQMTSLELRQVDQQAPLLRVTTPIATTSTFRAFQSPTTAPHHSAQQCIVQYHTHINMVTCGSQYLGATLPGLSTELTSQRGAWLACTTTTTTTLVGLVFIWVPATPPPSIGATNTINNQQPTGVAFRRARRPHLPSSRSSLIRQAELPSLIRSHQLLYET